MPKCTKHTLACYVFVDLSSYHLSKEFMLSGYFLFFALIDLTVTFLLSCHALL